MEVKVVSVARFCLYLIFFYVVFQSLFQWNEEQTTFEELYLEAPSFLPSVTICPMNQQAVKNITTFEEVMKEIERVKNDFGAEIVDTQIFHKTTIVDLKNETFLRDVYNKTFEEIWSFSPSMKQLFPFGFIICGTINPPWIQRVNPEEWITWIIITINGAEGGTLMIEKHEKGQSTHNFNLDRKTVEYIPTAGKFTIVTLSTFSINRLKKGSYHCNEQNTQKFTNCMNEFYVSKLNCSLPWWVKTSKRICKGREKFQEFFNLSKSVFQAEIHQEIKDFGCFIPNCKIRKWNVEMSRINNENVSNDKTLVGYLLPNNGKLLVRNEVKLYNFGNFIADCGGYLGLLLGESLISFIERLFI